MKFRNYFSFFNFICLLYFMWWNILHFLNGLIFKLWFNSLNLRIIKFINNVSFLNVIRDYLNFYFFRKVALIVFWRRVFYWIWVKGRWWWWWWCRLWIFLSLIILILKIFFSLIFSIKFTQSFVRFFKIWLFHISFFAWIWGILFIIIDIFLVF